MKRGPLALQVNPTGAALRFGARDCYTSIHTSGRVKVHAHALGFSYTQSKKVMSPRQVLKLMMKVKKTFL